VTPDVPLVWPATDDDLEDTAHLHVSELPHGLFPQLGPGFVRRWHRAHLRSPSGVVLVACAAADVVGFLVGSVDQRANVAWMLAHQRAELAVAGGLALARRPRLAASFLHTRGRSYGRRLLRPASAPAYESGLGAGPVAVLEAIVVDPAVRGTGVGSALVEAFLAEVASAGVERVELVTKVGARGAAGFYERQGWEPVGGHVDRDGDEVVTYRIAACAVEVR
jgi:GNAT superfamily N-acetyltransferase